MTLSIDEQIQLLSRRCERILTEPDLRRKLQASEKTGRPLRVKFGMDPTAPDVTLGHAVPLKVIRQFQELGHKAVLIIGDYTARVGDPSGRNSTRPVLSGEEIDANAKTYVAQIGKILLGDPAHLEVRWNGEWLGAMNLIEIIKLASRKSVAQMLERDNFKERYDKGDDIRIHEFLYPLLQGWDSVMIDADIEMGGSDQLFNNLVGREFQKEQGKDGQVVIVTPLLVGTDGVMKMSKSKGNYIAITDPPREMFQKLLRVKNELLESYFRLLTEVPEQEFKAKIATSPLDAKIHLAKEIVSWLYDPASADAAEIERRRTSHGGIPDHITDTYESKRDHWHWLPALLREAKLVNSSTEGRRKIQEGAIRVDGETITDATVQICLGLPDTNNPPPIPKHSCKYYDKPFVIQLGNKKFVRIVFD